METISRLQSFAVEMHSTNMPSIPALQHTLDMPASPDEIDSTNSDHDNGQIDVEDSEDLFSTFTLFPKLPLELRLKIWSEAYCVTRNLVLQIGYIGVKDEDAGWQPFYFYSTCAAPAVLSTCREARNEALQHYSLEFRVKETSKVWACPIAITFEAPATIYINWRTDRVCMFGLSGFEASDWTGDFQYTNRLQVLGQKFRDRGLRYLALEIESSDVDFSGYDEPHENLLSLSGIHQYLEELILFEQNEIARYSYQRDGPVKFGVLSQIEK
ncbi:hypothetical protein BKA65DRAFT_492596 [Rhexocercosporidium sp. MPI-PUGE-AT-0058]|nr:hypothetical protein BKA65DRAFT_492596 [Rhexocercosporidium sp. MPI-PUGE-AT-0058]